MNSITVYPSLNGWATPRTTDGQLTTDNCQLIISNKIENIKKVLVKSDDLRVSVYLSPTAIIADSCEVSRISTTKSDDGLIKELDITRRVVEKSFYLTLPATSWTNPYMGYDLYLQNTLYWEYNTNTIHIIGDKVRSYQWDARVFDQVIQCSLYDFTKEGKLFYKNNNGNYQEIYNFTSLNNYGKDIDPRKVKFRIYYTPLGETVSLTVPKTEPQEHQFTIPVSQQQPIVSSQAYGKNLQALANRTGVPVRIVKRKVNTLDQIRKLGSYWQETDNKSNRTGNIYTLTSQEIVLQGGYAICTERWSKNWMMQSEYVGINREFRSWNIPADIVQRNLHYQDYCYITSDKDFDKDGKFTKDCDLTDDAKKYVLHSLIGDGTGTNTECELMWFFNPDNPGVMENGVVLNCSAMGFGNSLVFSGKTKDNLSAGTQRVKSNDSDKKYQYCKDVFYCGEDGKMDKLFVQIGAEMTGGSDAAINMYPEVTALEIENEGHTVIMPINQPVGTVLFKDYDYFNVQKDPAEQLNFTYQLHLVTHNPDLIIGAGWANNCPLVVDRPNAVTLKYWHLNRPLPKGMQTMSSGWGEPLKTSPITNIDYAKGYFKIDANSCVTDAKNNVIVAYNGENPCTFYLKYTHDYDKLTQEYNSLNAGRYKDATYNINN